MYGFGKSGIPHDLMPHHEHDSSAKNDGKHCFLVSFPISLTFPFAFITHVSLSQGFLTKLRMIPCCVYALSTEFGVAMLRGRTGGFLVVLPRIHRKN